MSEATLSRRHPREGGDLAFAVIPAKAGIQHEENMK
jgi:hypothetical protein